MGDWKLNDVSERIKNKDILRNTVIIVCCCFIKTHYDIYEISEIQMSYKTADTKTFAKGKKAIWKLVKN